jgi:hypothetical protein
MFPDYDISLDRDFKLEDYKKDIRSSMGGELSITITDQV